VQLEPVLHGVHDHVQGERSTAGYPQLRTADRQGRGAGAERLPQDFVGSSQQRQAAVQVDGAGRAAVLVSPAAEGNLYGRLCFLLEGVKPRQQVSEAE